MIAPMAVAVSATSPATGDVAGRSCSATRRDGGPPAGPPTAAVPASGEDGGASGACPQVATPPKAGKVADRVSVTGDGCAADDEAGATLSPPLRSPAGVNACSGMNAGCAVNAGCGAGWDAERTTVRPPRPGEGESGTPGDAVTPAVAGDATGAGGDGHDAGAVGPVDSGDVDGPDGSSSGTGSTGESRSSSDITAGGADDDVGGGWTGSRLGRSSSMAVSPSLHRLADALTDTGAVTEPAGGRHRQPAQSASWATMRSKYTSSPSTAGTSGSTPTSSTPAMKLPWAAPSTLTKRLAVVPAASKSSRPRV